MQEVAIPTPDGDARAYSFHPDGKGPWPAVIFFMDAPAIRPALFQMCERLASNGYFVLLPDMFWRAGPYAPINMAEAFKDEESRRAIFGKFMASTAPVRSSRDTGAFLDWLAKQPEVKGDKVGITGYCMGGGLSLRAAGDYPDRVIASAGFHGGRLATDAPDSPHLLAPKIKARMYFGIASNDDMRQPDAKDKLKEAFTAAKVPVEIEVYSGSLHGWCVPDMPQQNGMPIYNKPDAERAWAKLLALYKAAIA